MLGILHVLAERVGPGGRVVGIDRQARMVDAARRLAEQHPLAVELIQADATATGLPDDTFDLVHARTLLLNVENPADVVEEMARIAKPGAVVAVQEPDAAAWLCDPPHSAFDTLRAAVVDAYRRTGKDFNIGRRTHQLLRDAGLRDVNVRPTARATTAGEYYQTFLPAIASLVGDVIVDSGALTADELASHLSALRSHLDRPGTITCQPVIWQAWGKTATSP